MQLVQDSLEAQKAEAATKPPFRVFVRVRRSDWPTNLGEIHAPFVPERQSWVWRFTVIGGSGHIHATDWLRESAKVRRLLSLPMIEDAA